MTSVIPWRWQHIERADANPCAFGCRDRAYPLLLVYEYQYRLPQHVTLVSSARGEIKLIKIHKFLEALKSELLQINLNNTTKKQLQMAAPTQKHFARHFTARLFTNQTR